MPYHVNPENALFYPLKLPLIFFSFFKAAALLRLLNTVVASIGCYLLIRSYRAHPVSAAAGALMFSYGSFMAYEFVHIPYVSTAVWFPWQLMFLNRLIRRPSFKGALLLATVTALSFLGGSPGIFLTCQFTLFFFFAAGLVRTGLSRRWTRLGRMAGWLAFSVAAVIGLTLVLLLPAFRFIEHTPRADGLKELANFHDFAMIPEALQSLFFPWLHIDFGAPYPPIYPIFFISVPFVGMGALLLALFNLRSRRHAALLPVALSALLFGLLMAMGERTAFLPWMMEQCALFRWFRWPHDYLLMAYLVLPVVAATGFDAFWRERRGRAKRFGVIALLYVMAGLVWAPRLSSLVALLAVAAAVGLGLLPAIRRWAGSLPSRSRVAVAALLLLLLAAELFAYGYRMRIYLPARELDLGHCREAIEWVKSRGPHDRVAFAAPAGGAYFAGRERFFSRHIQLVEEKPAGNIELTDFDRWIERVDAPELGEKLWQRRHRFHDLDDTHWAYPVNASMSFRYQEVSGYDPFAIDRALKLFRTLPVTKSWELLGVRHVVTSHLLVHEGMEQVHRSDSLNVYRNADATPRAVVPLRVRGAMKAEEILERMRSDDFDAEREVMLEEALPAGMAGTTGSARIVEYEPELVIISAALDGPGVVVLHDAYHPDWEVRVDGEVGELLRANYLFRAVAVPGGRHEVRFVYRPASFIVAAWVSGGSWIAALLALAFVWKRRSSGP
jgi:hypothetical protein